MSAWKQSRMNTCGPACMMAALHETGMGGLSRERETAIWRKVRHPFFLGSLPSSMALYAASQGLAASLWRRREKPGGTVPKKLTLLHVIHRHLIHKYFYSAEQAKKRGLAVREYGASQETLDPLLGEKGAMAIPLVIDDDGYFHFILARERQGQIAVMDPYYGKNTLYAPSLFLERLGPAMAGYVILISP